MHSLTGQYAIGHTRYSTTGKSMGTNTQPFVVETIHGPIALAHNGQLTQGRAMRKALMKRGVGMFTSSDSENILQTIASRPDLLDEEGEKANWEARIASFMLMAEGAYSCVLLTKDALFGWRDPHGLRPLCIGTVTYDIATIGSNGSLSNSNSLSAVNSTIPAQHTTGYAISSESCSFSTIGGSTIRDVRPGELVRIDDKGITSFMIFGPPLPSSKLSNPRAVVYPQEVTTSSASPLPPSLERSLSSDKVKHVDQQSQDTTTKNDVNMVKDFSSKSNTQEDNIVPNKQSISITSQSSNLSHPLVTSLELIKEAFPAQSKKESSSVDFPVPGHHLPAQTSFCIFEYVYFARPDSVIEGRLVHAVRQGLGHQLAVEHPVPHADVVVGVPDSSTPTAIGYSQKSGIPYTEGLTKNRYIARTFIQPEQSLRVAAVELKYNTLGANLKDKVVVLVDDSIVRGTTVAQLVGLLKKGGAKEVHVRIGSPPVKHPCFMGIDMKTEQELIASKVSVDGISKMLGADSLAYISHQGMVSAVLQASSKEPQDAAAATAFCSACFTGDYPVPVESW